MGRLNRFAGKTLYLDANAFVYVIEDFPDARRLAKELIETLDARECVGVTSELSLSEVLVRPFLEDDQEAVEEYLQFFKHPRITVVPVTLNILIDAARVRARTRAKLPDAIHLATALSSECSLIVSDDRGLPSVTGLTRVSLLG